MEISLEIVLVTSLHHRTLLDWYVFNLRFMEGLKKALNKWGNTFGNLSDYFCISPQYEREATNWQWHWTKWNENFYLVHPRCRQNQNFRRGFLEWQGWPNTTLELETNQNQVLITDQCKFNGKIKHPQFISSVCQLSVCHKKSQEKVEMFYSYPIKRLFQLVEHLKLLEICLPCSRLGYQYWHNSKICPCSHYLSRLVSYLLKK